MCRNVIFNTRCDVLAKKSISLTHSSLHSLLLPSSPFLFDTQLSLSPRGLDVVAPGADGEKGKVPMRAPLVPDGRYEALHQTPQLRLASEHVSCFRTKRL
jgi:hypothetical protein